MVLELVPGKWGVPAAWGWGDDPARGVSEDWAVVDGPVYKEVKRRAWLRDGKAVGVGSRPPPPGTNGRMMRRLGRVLPEDVEVLKEARGDAESPQDAAPQYAAPAQTHAAANTMGWADSDT